jgi:hypothetical protein
MAGWLLAIGSLSFIVGASNPALAPVWSAPPDVQLRLIHDAATGWTVTNVLFGVGAVLTAAGLWPVAERVGTGGQSLARAAAVVYAIAVAAWISSLAFRLAVTPPAAASFADSGVMDPTYVLVSRWGNGMFSAFTYLSGASVTALGVALVRGRTLRTAVGWFAIVVGLVITLGYAVAGDMPPFLSFVPTGLLGLFLLRRPGVHDSERPLVPRPDAAP